MKRPTPLGNEHAWLEHLRQAITRGRILTLGFLLLLLLLASPALAQLPEASTQPEPLTAEGLSAFVGNFATFAGSNRRVTISLDGDQLKVRDARGQGGPLEHQGDTTFLLLGQQELAFEQLSERGYDAFRLSRPGASATGVLFRRGDLLETQYRATAGQLRPHALSSAVVMNDSVSVQALIAAGADVEELDTRIGIGGRNGRRPLNWAAQMDHAEMLALLLDAGADINSTNKSGFTPLHHAAESSSAGAARLLIERGADLEAVSQRGQTPLEIALRTTNGDVAELIQSALESSVDKEVPAETPNVYAAPNQREDGLQVASLEDVEADEEKIHRLLNNLENGAYEDVDSLLILKGGKLVVEQYYGPWTADRPHPMQSVSKSITALLVGSALRQGHIDSLSEKVAKYLPDHAELLTDSRAEITIEDLLTMSAGFDWNEHNPAYGQPGNVRFEEVLSKDSVGFTLERPHINPPGSVFTYSGGYVTVAGEILVNATGADSVLDYLSRSTLAELEFEGHGWLPQADGRQNTAGGLMLRPRDLAKVGLMMLDGGIWKGKRLLDEQFVEDALSPKIGSPGAWNEYGYYWWGRSLETESGSYALDAAQGWGGQELILVPKLELVVVLTATNYLLTTPTASILVNFILPAFD